MAPASQYPNFDATTDTIVFEGQSIAGNIPASSVDQYGRAYTLSNGTLTITSGNDAITIENFKQGDFGVGAANDNCGVFLKKCA